MLGLAQSAGHELTAEPADADVLVVNTCAFIDSAKQESIDAILEMAQHKKDGSCQRLIVTGCLAERYRDELRKRDPRDRRRARHRRGPRDRRRDRGAARRRCTFYRRAPVHAGTAAPGTWHRAPGTQHPAPSTRSPTYIYDAETPRLLATPRHYAYVKIAEGCDYKCAFCIIPTLRGRLSQPAGRLDRPGSAGAGRPRRQGTAAHLAGHDVLRHRSPASAARSPGCCAS